MTSPVPDGYVLPWTGIGTPSGWTRLPDDHRYYDTPAFEDGPTYREAGIALVVKGSVIPE